MKPSSPSSPCQPILLPLLALGFSISSTCVYGDALVVTKAMQATTVAEILVTEASVRVELEIGVADLLAFADLLPDELYAALDIGDTPLAERRPRFFREGLVVRDETGTMLAGRVESVVARRRLVRDEVTGEPLAMQSVDTKPVVFVTLVYDLPQRPTSLTFQTFSGSNTSANVGFMCYHNSLPINDFRYLSQEVTLDLDWDDPWHSRFRHRNLRRQFDAPLSVYLYVEPYEVRQEIIVRPRDLQELLDLGIKDKAVIPVEQQRSLKEKVAQFLSKQSQITIDGQAAQGRLDRIHFIRRSLRTTGIVEPPEELDVTSATLGVIFVFPVDRLPDEVSMTWDLFTPTIQQIPAVASDEAGGLPSELTPAAPVLVWKNYLTNPTIPQLAEIAPPPLQQIITIPVITVLCASVLAALLVRMARTANTDDTVSPGAITVALALIVIGVATLPFVQVTLGNPFASSVNISNAEARELVTGLLHNVYRAFDHHDESLIYDQLSQSIAGDMLSEVYLDTRRSMEVKNQGGLRISVKEVSVSELEPVRRLDDSAIVFRCRWRVAGWIGHWGHVHSRVNEHAANLTIAPVDGQWKITAIEMLDEQPIELPQQSATAS